MRRSTSLFFYTRALQSTNRVADREKRGFTLVRLWKVAPEHLDGHHDAEHEDPVLLKVPDRHDVGEVHAPGDAAEEVRHRGDAVEAAVVEHRVGVDRLQHEPLVDDVVHVQIE